MSVEPSSPPRRPDPPENKELAEATSSTSATTFVHWLDPLASKTAETASMSATASVQALSPYRRPDNKPTTSEPAEYPYTSSTTSFVRALKSDAIASAATRSIVQETALVVGANNNSFATVSPRPPASTGPVPRLIAKLAQRPRTAAPHSTGLEVVVVQERPIKKRVNEDSSGDEHVPKWQLLDQELLSDGTSGGVVQLFSPPSEPEEIIDAPPSPEEGSAADFFVPPALPHDIDNW